MVFFSIIVFFIGALLLMSRRSPTSRAVGLTLMFIGGKTSWRSSTRKAVRDYDFNS